MRRPINTRVTLREIADSLGISVSTVSRALNPSSRHSVTPKLTAEIQRASQALGYTPNAAAYSLKTNRSRTIGVVIPDIADPVFPPIIRGIEQGLSARNYVAILGNTDGEADAEAKTIETMSARGVDGFILASVTRKGPAALKSIDGKPVVTVIRALDGTNVPSVTHDQSEGVRRLLTHLVSLGHRDIANIAGPQDISTGFQRLRAFEQHCKLMGIRYDKSLVAVSTHFTENEGERCAEELSARGIPFTAVICANDRLAIGAIAAFERHGLSCPDDVSVTGMNDMPLVDRLKPPLTTVRNQHFQAGLDVAEMIIQCLESPDAPKPKNVVLPVDLVVRGSTGVPSKRQSPLERPSARKPALSKPRRPSWLRV